MIDVPQSDHDFRPSAEPESRPSAEHIFGGQYDPISSVPLIPSSGVGRSRVQVSEDPDIVTSREDPDFISPEEPDSVVRKTSISYSRRSQVRSQEEA